MIGVVSNIFEIFDIWLWVCSCNLLSLVLPAAVLDGFAGLLFGLVICGIFRVFFFFGILRCVCSCREKKNDFAVLCSIYVPDFEYLSKAFPVGATSIYLLDV